MEISFILTKWYVNLFPIIQIEVFFKGFILTKWYVNKMRKYLGAAARIAFYIN